MADVPTKAGALFEVRNEDGQVVSTHATNAEAQATAARLRNDREAAHTYYAVFGPVYELLR